MNWNFGVNCITATSPDGCPGPWQFLTLVIVMDSFKVPLEMSGRSALELETLLRKYFHKVNETEQFLIPHACDKEIYPAGGRGPA